MHILLGYKKIWANLTEKYHMDVIINTKGFSTFPALRRFAASTLFGMLGAFFALPAGAAIFSYQLSGSIASAGDNT
ncbi:MAG: hypothetical protein BMS9Abin06_1022 [Gammaproteobacteria bacterium]|nr:MAG: hypothetical protein BMS9Abin06_1022 [Gammaproteobacteria bacterium]